VSEPDSSSEAAVDERRALAVVFAVVFVDLLGFGILIPIIPLYAASFGGGGFVVGLLTASYSAMQFLTAPFLGQLSDARGRKPVLLLSLLGSVIAWALFGLAWSLLVLFAARILAGLLAGNVAAAQALIADVTPPEERAKGLGLVGAAFGLGFVFGPALGGLLSSDAAVHFFAGVLPAVVPVTKFSLPSFAAAALSLVNLTAATVVLPETNPPGANTGDEGAATDTAGAAETGRLAMLRRALAAPAIRTLVVAFFVVSFAFSGMEAMFVLFVDRVFGFGTTQSGYVLAYVGVVIAVLQGGLVGRLTARYGESRLAVSGAALLAVSLVALPFSDSIGRVLPPLPLGSAVVALLAVLTVLSVGDGLLVVSLNTLVSRSADAALQGEAFGLTQSAGSLARAVGPPLAGLLYVLVGYWSPFVVGGLIVAPVALLLASFVGDRLATPTGA